MGFPDCEIEKDNFRVSQGTKFERETRNLLNLKFSNNSNIALQWFCKLASVRKVWNFNQAEPKKCLTHLALALVYFQGRNFHIATWEERKYIGTNFRGKKLHE